MTTTDPPMALGPGYTEDITVAGSLLYDKIENLYEVLTGIPRNTFSQFDLHVVPDLKLKVDKVQLVNRFASSAVVPSRISSSVGVLYVTTTNLIFVDDESGREIWVLHSHIGSVERGALSAAGCPLLIRCRHFLTLSLIIPRDKDCHDVYQTLLQCSQPVNLEEVYAFSYVPVNKELERSLGWTSVDLETEFRRQQVPNELWSSTDFNHNYQCCETYPERLYVPANVPKQILIGSCKFRSKNRLPALAYFYAKTKAAICRCSQPLAGFSARCVEDETMMQYILKANPTCGVLYLVDTRPMLCQSSKSIYERFLSLLRLNAVANKAAGKGYEDERHYANMRFHFFSIENIHVMRTSLQKLIDVCHKPRSVTDFLRGLDSSGWLRHIRLILECAAFLSDSVRRGISCVVHCSDGWDRTAQTVSMASLLLDPHYRTITGFRTLVEKDWLSFGHKFSDRCGHAGSANGSMSNSFSGATDEESAPSVPVGTSKEESPVFTQFLDCTWQLMRQYPRAFEFHERYLIEMHDQVYSCQFGTFLGNCDKDRKDLRLSERTYSLWGYMDSNWTDYLNPLYLPDAFGPIVPDLRPQAIQFWRSMYNRFDEGVHPRETIDEASTAVAEHINSLHDHANVLISRIAELKQLLSDGSATKTAMVDSGHSSGVDGSASSSATACSSNNGSSNTLTQQRQNDDEDALSPLHTLGRSRTPKMCQLRNSMTSSTGLAESLTSLDLSSTDLSSPEVAAVAVRLQSTRKAVECTVCAATFAYIDKKCHCTKCGAVHCRRCVDAQLAVNVGLSPSTSALHCKACLAELKAIPVVTDATQ